MSLLLSLQIPLLTLKDWQSLVLFHSARVVGQKGTITRIASGCDEEKKRKLSDLYHHLYGDIFNVHFTPDFKKDTKTNRACIDSCPVEDALNQ